MRASSAALWAALAASGCSKPTTLMIDARVAVGTAVPSTLSVSVFDPHGARLLSHALDATRLPGSLLVSGLPAQSETVRVVLAGGAPASLGFARVPLLPHDQVRAVIELSSATSDRDGDGVPDEIDDCPDVPDPKQANARGDGAGDACGGSDLAMIAPEDLAGADLKSVDLARHFGDASIDAVGGSLCAGAPFLLCDGFETGTLEAPWVTDIVRSPQDGGPPPTVKVEAGRAYRGTHAVHEHVDLLNGTTYIQALFRQNDVGPMGHIFVRAFFYIDNNLAGNGTNFWSITEDVDPYGGIVMGIGDNGLLGYFSYYLPNELNAVTTTSMPYAQWVCMEWEIDDGPTPTTDAGTGAMRVYMNEVEVPSAHVDQLWTKPFFHGYSFGFDFGSGSSPVGPLDIWVDEVVIDSARVGCAN